MLPGTRRRLASKTLEQATQDILRLDLARATAAVLLRTKNAGKDLLDRVGRRGRTGLFQEPTTHLRIWGVQGTGESDGNKGFLSLLPRPRN